MNHSWLPVIKNFFFFGGGSGSYYERGLLWGWGGVRERLIICLGLEGIKRCGVRINLGAQKNTEYCRFKKFLFFCIYFFSSKGMYLFQCFRIPF